MQIQEIVLTPSKCQIWNFSFNESVSKNLEKAANQHIQFIFFYVGPEDILTIELPVPVLLLTTPSSLAVYILVVFVVLSVLFVVFSSPVALLFVLVAFNFLVNFWLYLEGLLDHFM